ncbi:MAG: recombinase RecT, partial [Brachymonas sp.]|nr:recombinase RecT [Brachymonas sp.]
MESLRGRTPAPATAQPKSLSQIHQMPKDRQAAAMIEAFKGQIAAALPAHLSADRMARVALTAMRQNPALLDCDPTSVFASVLLAAQLGLEIGVDGQAYLVPYKGKCTFVPGWKGYVEMVNRAGRASIWTGAVFKG